MPPSRVTIEFPLVRALLIAGLSLLVHASAIAQTAVDFALIENDGAVFDESLINQISRDARATNRRPFTSEQFDSGSGSAASSPAIPLATLPVLVGYDDGFVVASRRNLDLQTGDYPYRMRLNGYGQLRWVDFDPTGNPDVDGQPLNQLQLARARLSLSGNVISNDFDYFVQIDGRSNSGDNLRLLDYYFRFDFARYLWDCEPGTLGVRVGRYKMPFTLSRAISGQQFQFADRSMASTFFDVNRSLGAGLYGATNSLAMPIFYEAAVFNGLVTGGAETGSSGQLDDNNAIAMHAYLYPTGDWGEGELADFEIHDHLATRVGGGFATTTIDRSGATEFASVRVVDTGQTLADVLPLDVIAYDADLFCVAGSMKYRGFSATLEYYFRTIRNFRGNDALSDSELFDHGFWVQSGYFVFRDKLELVARWSRVDGESASLGETDRSSDEIAGGLNYYFRRQRAKITFDATHLNGATVDSSALNIEPGYRGWLVRTQMQFGF